MDASVSSASTIIALRCRLLLSDLDLEHLILIPDRELVHRQQLAPVPGQDPAQASQLLGGIELRLDLVRPRHQSPRARTRSRCCHRRTRRPPPAARSSAQTATSRLRCHPRPAEGTAPRTGSSSIPAHCCRARSSRDVAPAAPTPFPIPLPWSIGRGSPPPMASGRGRRPPGRARPKGAARRRTRRAKPSAGSEVPVRRRRPARRRGRGGGGREALALDEGGGVVAGAAQTEPGVGDEAARREERDHQEAAAAGVVRSGGGGRLLGVGHRAVAPAVAARLASGHDTLAPGAGPRGSAAPAHVLIREPS